MGLMGKMDHQDCKGFLDLQVHKDPEASEDPKVEWVQGVLMEQLERAGPWEKKALWVHQENLDSLGKWAN